MFLKVHGLARLTRNPEVKNIQASKGEMTVVNFSVACSEKNNAKEFSAFYEAKCFGKLAEIIGERLTKGSRIYLNGKLTQETWENEGQKRSKHVILLESFEFADSRREGNTQGEQQDSDFSDDIPF